MLPFTASTIAQTTDEFLRRYHLTSKDVISAVSRYDVECAFVTGSFLQGRAGPTSDLDIRAICCPSAHHPPRDLSFSREDTLWCGTHTTGLIMDIPLHVVYWPTDGIKLLLSKIDEAQFSIEASVPIFSDQQVEFLEEIAISLGIIHSERIEELKSRIPMEKVQVIRFHQLMSRYEQCCGETESPLATGDVLLALFRSRRAIETAYDCCLHVHGKPVSKEKWRLRHLLEIFPRDHEMVQNFLFYMLQAPELNDRKALSEFIWGGLNWCNEFLAQIQTEIDC